MTRRVLVTGGAGFIGSHLVDALLARGHEVRVLDSLDPQVHGPQRQPPAYLNRSAELIVGDVRDRDALHQALQGIRVVFHEAAAVGVGQSMYEIARYVEANTQATAVLLETIVQDKLPIEKIIVASSMSVYGEGQYRCEACGVQAPTIRPEPQLARREWEFRCACGQTLTPTPTPETKPLFPTSVYAITKRDHEELVLTVGRAYGIPAVALRYFNVYGSRQALSNPYTGVAAIFSGRLLNRKAPIIFEDGRQTRDFVHVSDIVQANLLAMEQSEADGEAFNVGTGRPVSILEVARWLGERLGVAVEPEMTGQFRAGDIRHCVADISKIVERLGFEPEVAFEDGLEELVAWVREQRAEDRVEEATRRLASLGLTR